MRKGVNILKKYEFILKDLHCANCARAIEEELQKNSDLQNVNLNFAKLKLTYETSNVLEEEVIRTILSIEPDIEVVRVDENSNNIENKTNKKLLLQVARLIIGIIIALLGLYMENKIGNNALATMIIILGYAILLYRTAKNAGKLLIKSHSINENFLITISSIGAYLVGEHLEGLMVITLYEIGKILEDKAINKSRKSISDLMNIKPEYANLKKNKGIKKVLPEDVKVGDIVVIKQGEKVPLDGVIVSGEANLNMASLTGESKLRKVKIDDEILSGSINEDGLIEIRVSKEYKNSTVSRILDLVENATDKKAKTETFVNKAAKIYTPIVLLLAVLVTILLPIINKEITYSESFYRALIFLVISCPCSIAISVPLSYFSGIGKASKNGILIKGSNFLDNLKDIKEIGFDKTGTLTKGQFGISKIDIVDKSYSKEEILRYTILGESFSNHPIAKSIIKSANISVDTAEVNNYNEISGKGISYEIGDKKVVIGNAHLVNVEEETSTDTIIYMSINEKLVSKIYLSDVIKVGAKAAIEKLNSLGINTKMCTGDNLEVAKKVAKEIGIKEVKAEMLPEDKYAEIEKTISKYKGTNNRVAFVGDGINDSPVLAISDIGISMGGVGSSAAIEASDIVIMTDDLSKIPEAIQISKKTCNIIKQNLIFAISVKLIILLLSVLGIGGMWEAIFADVGVTLITIFNTLRILK